MDGPRDSVTPRLFEEFLRRMHLARPSDVADVVAEEAAAALGASDVVLLLADHEGVTLVPVPSSRPPVRDAVQIEGTLAGRCFAMTEVVVAPVPQDGRRRTWVPVLDGTERLGVLELTVDATGDRVAPALVTLLERYGHLVAQAVVTKNLYGDVFEMVRRSRPMTVGAELLWSVLPPQTYATDGLVISAMLEPAYDNGGDAFDYAVNQDRAHLAVFDAMGHGLSASAAAVFAVAAYRNSRRAGECLVECCAGIDAALAEQFDDRFVTGVFAELDLASGRLTWVNAGHPPPLLVRRARVVKRLEVTPVTPLGLRLSPRSDIVVGEEQLEPGDLLLVYTDGLTEARQRGGDFLTEEGLTDFLRQEATAELPTPEMLRRFRHTLLERVGGVLRDDASAVLMHWRDGAERRLLPSSAE